MRDYYMCYPAILINTLVPQLGLSSILQNQLGVALDALTVFTPTADIVFSAVAVGALHCQVRAWKIELLGLIFHSV